MTDQRPILATRRGRTPMPSNTDLHEADLEPGLLDLASHLFDLAREGDAATLAAYLDAGAPVDLTNSKGDTLLMLAAYHGHESVVAELLMRGADPDRPNDRGQTPLGAAVFKDALAIANLLLMADADPFAGSPSAIETAHFFGRSGYLEQFGPAGTDRD